VTASSITPPILLLLVGAVMSFVGSMGAWATANIGPISFSVSGTNSGVSQSYGVNGWITFALGLTLVILAILEVVSNEASLRSLAVLVSFIALGFAIYFFSRVVHDIATAQPHQSLFPIASVDIGWGIIVLLIGAVGAFAGAVSAARSS
jgi:hypothetical protein